MSREHTWKAFGQLLSSPVLSHGRPSRKKHYHESRKKTASKCKSQSKDGRDDFRIEDASDDDMRMPLACSKNQTETQPFTYEHSLATSINPAEVTVVRNNPSDSEIEDVSEDEPTEQNEITSDESGSDDCVAIHCKKSKMTRLNFADNKRRQITDDLEFTFSTKKVKKSKHELIDVFKSFKTITQNPNATSHSKTPHGKCIALSPSPDRSISKCGWKEFDKSFSEQELKTIEDLPPSPEEYSFHHEKPNQDDLLNIEELPSSAEATVKSTGISPADPAASLTTTFYVSSLTNKTKTRKYPEGSALATLSTVLAEKNSKWNFWQHEMVSGLINPEWVVKVHSIERSFGRVMLRFYTTQRSNDEEKRIENIIYLDPGDKQLKTIRAGMEIALEPDERISPHTITANRTVYLGVAKLCPMQPISK